MVTHKIVTFFHYGQFKFIRLYNPNVNIILLLQGYPKAWRQILRITFEAKFDTITYNNYDQGWYL